MAPPASSSRHRSPPLRHPNWTLAATILASSLAFIDGSVVNVALPAIGHSLGGDASGLQWTINAYMLPLSALLLMGGAAGDHFGRRRLLVIGITLFTLASIGCALARELNLLLAARAVQGIGAAILLPNSLAILGNAFTGEAKGRAIGTWAAAGAIAGAIGPALGGWLVGTIGWRPIFLLNVPMATAAIAIALLAVRESGEGRQPLDWAGAALATAALFALTWALTLWSSTHALSANVWIGIAAGLSAMALFLWTEHRRGERAMMPLQLFGSRAFGGLTLLTFLLYAALGGLILLLPYVLIVGGGYSPLQAGAALLPFSIGIGFGSRLMGRIAERVGPRLPLTLGPIVAGLGFALLVRVEPQASYWTSILPGMAVLALGLAGAVAPLTTAVLSSVDDAHTGTASGFNSAIARTGGLIATALAGAVIAQSGTGLIAAFHAAALIGAGLAIAAGCVGFLTLPAGSKTPDNVS
ncbi:MFS transporter [Sphingomonas sp.]|uniref:MFS transporter n=1 Tax=Sphingomonas sp. TaxID=28214 RepID=UPI003B3B739A